MRWDRLLTLFIFAPLLRCWRRHGLKHAIPILMYHSINDELDQELRPYYRVVTSPDRFELQLAALKLWGYQGITLSEAISRFKAQSVEVMSADQAAKSSDHVPQKYVVLTFDDGFRDFYTNAFPLLQKYGFTATVFLATDYIGKTFVNGKPCLSESEIQMLHDSGIEFGSHSQSHRLLKDLPDEELAQEAKHSKIVIEKILGKEITTFSFPYRYPEENLPFTEKFNRVLASAGYMTSVTTIIGLGWSVDLPFNLKRLPINDCDDADLMLAKLTGGYDWLHSLQLLYKKMRSFTAFSTRLEAKTQS